MPERNFFNLRYALPGYTFILIMILVAYPVLIEKIIEFTEASIDFTLVSALLAFFTLLSGGAIGFLISQFWYFFHNSFFNKFSLLDTRKFLRDKFNLDKNTHQEIVFLDYVFHSSEDKIINYVARRFDLQHTLGSTFLAVIFGTIFGVFIKIEFFLANASSSDLFGLLFLPAFTIYDFEIIIIIGSLLFVIMMGFRFIRKEHAMMVNIAVRKVVLSEKKVTEKEVEKIFSEKYFKKKIRSQKFGELLG